MVGENEMSLSEAFCNKAKAVSVSEKKEICQNDIFGIAAKTIDVLYMNGKHCLVRYVKKEEEEEERAMKKQKKSESKCGRLNESNDALLYNREIQVKISCSSGEKDEGEKDLSWNVFDQYLKKCIPVKIFDYSNFNKVKKEKGEKNQSCTTAKSFKEYLSVLNLPEKVLNSKIIAQCHFSNKDDDEKDEKVIKERNKRKKMYNYINSKLTVLPQDFVKDDCNLSSTPFFLGQGDQPHIPSTLRNVLFWDDGKKNQMVQLNIAQETILQRKKSTEIICNDNGTLSYSSKTSTDVSTLGNYLHSPSYLLPKHSTSIDQVNIWFSSNACHTNYHYDSRHNILCMLHGSKTIELCPPASIRACPISSEYANHAIFYSPLHLMSSNEEEEVGCKSLLEETHQKLQNNSIVVKISAGEALFIPQGWWHHVISSHHCFAFNVWFDHKISHTDCNDVVGSKQHMIPFYIRNYARHYWEIHHEDCARKLIQLSFLEKKKEFLFKYQIQEDDLALHQILQKVQKCLRSLDRTLLSNELIEYLNIFFLQIDFDEMNHCEKVKIFFEEWITALAPNEKIQKTIPTTILDKFSFSNDIFFKLECNCYFILSKVFEKYSNDNDEGNGNGNGDDHKKEWVYKFFETIGNDFYAHMQQQINEFLGKIQNFLIVDDLIQGKL